MKCCPQTVRIVSATQKRVYKRGLHVPESTAAVRSPANKEIGFSGGPGNARVPGADRLPLDGHVTVCGRGIWNKAPVNSPYLSCTSDFNQQRFADLIVLTSHIETPSIFHSVTSSHSRRSDSNMHAFTRSTSTDTAMSAIV